MQAAARGRDDQVLVRKRAQKRLRVGALGDGVLPERLPDDRRLLKQGSAPSRIERVEAGGEHGVDRLGQGCLAGDALLEDAVHHLLGEERVAARALGHLGDQRVLDLLRALGQQGLDELARAGRLQRLERDRRRVASTATPAGPAVKQLVASEADQKDRAPHPPRQVLDQVEHSLVRPVDVLDREDDGPLAARRLDERANRREEPGADLLRVVGLRRLGEPLGDLDAEGTGKRRGESLGRFVVAFDAVRRLRSFSNPARRRPNATSESSVSVMPNWSRTISPSAQYARPEP